MGEVVTSKTFVLCGTLVASAGLSIVAACTGDPPVAFPHSLRFFRPRLAVFSARQPASCGRVRLCFCSSPRSHWSK